MHVAIIVEDITKRAGTERAVANLAGMLSQESMYGVHIISLYSRPGEACSYPMPAKVRLMHLGMSRCGIGKRCLQYMQAARQIRSACKRLKIDAVIGTAHALNCLLYFLGDVHKIACEHMNYGACPFPARIIRRCIYPRLDAVILLTRADARRYHFVPGYKKHVIPNSLPLPYSQMLKSSMCHEGPCCHNRQRSSMGQQGKVMIAAGRLEKQKGFDMLLLAAARIREEAKGWEMHIYGDGSQKRHLGRMVKQLGLRSFVKFYAPIGDIQEKYLDAAIYVMPSRWEGLPMALIESQACALPAVSFDCPQGPGEIIKDGVNGFLIPPGDIEAFSEKLLLLMKAAKVREEMGANALRMAKRYESTRILQKWDNVFAHLGKAVR